MLTDSADSTHPHARRAMLALAMGIMALASACAQRDRPPSGTTSDAPGATETQPSQELDSGPAAVERAPLALIAVTEGLRPAHLGAAPLLEKVAWIPAVERGDEPGRAASRVYPDGAYYILVSELSGAPVSPRWSYLSSLSADGVAQLEALFAEICAEADSVRADDTGSVEYLVTSARCTRRLVAGLPSGSARILEADSIINRTMQQIPPGP